MIQAKKREDLTIENVLKRVSEYEIYRLYLGKDFEVGTSIHSPFRDDKSPSFFIGNMGGFLHHHDMGDSKKKGNCIQLVQQLYSLNYNEALLKVDHDFCLGIVVGESLREFRAVAKQARVPVIKEKKSPLIQVVTKKRMTKEELEYWNSFHISEEILKKHDVYSVKDLWLDRKRFPMSKTELIFGYLYDDKWKIYRPYASRESKWMSNVPTRRMDGLSNIVKCEKVVITKSKKDLMVLEQVFPTVCSVQSENTGAIDNTSLSLLRESAPEIYTNFDCDEAGKKNSWYFTRDFGFKHINVPDQYYQQYNIKDFADLGRKFGIEEIIKCFKSKNLL